ncbi:MAG: phosphatidate cytidylyltransferase [Actinomycetota bacterium]|nr:phosphatidate cytidylyltransferase [Actinomycetota bacterium]
MPSDPSSDGYRLVVDLSDPSSEPGPEPSVDGAVPGAPEEGAPEEGAPRGASGASERTHRRGGGSGSRSTAGAGGADRARSGSRRSTPRRSTRKVPQAMPPKGSRVLMRLLTGLALGAIVLTCVELGPFASLLFALAVVLTSAAEWFSALRKTGHHPATLVGLLGSAGVMVAAYSRGIDALPLVFVLTAVVTFSWYLFGAVRSRSTVNVATTLLGFGWIGLFGSYAGLLLNPVTFPQRHGVAFFFAAVITTIGYDVGAYAVGARYGRRLLLPAVSPKKTVEGLMGGTFGALLVALVIVSEISPWSIGSAFALGLVISVVAPLGDLVESLMKRDIGIKDMSSVLPGHGGVLDRVDAILFALPATYYLVVLLGVH